MPTTYLQNLWLYLGWAQLYFTDEFLTFNNPTVVKSTPKYPKYQCSQDYIYIKSDFFI